VAVFLGGGVRDEEHTESGFVAGLDYEYRLTHLLGAGSWWRLRPAISAR
jgi:hypothetical protein